MIQFTDSEYDDPVETLKRVLDDLRLDVEVSPQCEIEISRHGKTLAKERFLP